MSVCSDERSGARIISNDSTSVHLDNSHITHRTHAPCNSKRLSGIKRMRVKVIKDEKLKVDERNGKRRGKKREEKLNPKRKDLQLTDTCV